jgi:biotin carboxylase
VAEDERERSRRLLVLGAGTAQLGLLEAARANGIWTAVCDRDPTAPGFRLAARRCIVSTHDEPVIERLAAALGPDGVIAPGSNWPVGVAARVAAKLGLAHPVAPATAALVTSRLRQRERLAAAGVPQPRWEVVGSEPGELGPPCVVKTVEREGGEGLSLVLDETELPAAIEMARARSRSGAVLVEEYLDGPEVTVSAFSVDGELIPLAVSDRAGTDDASDNSPLAEVPPAFGVALAHTWPSLHAEAAVEVTRRAIEALRVENGPSHTHLRVSRGGPEVLEVAARLGGAHDAELVLAATGVDLNALALAAALGERVTVADVARGYSERVGGAVTRFLVAPPGELESVEVPQGLAGVVTVRLYHERGHVFSPLRRASDRAGAVLVVGATREEAVLRADVAVERIRFATVDAGALV